MFKRRYWSEPKRHRKREKDTEKDTERDTEQPKSASRASELVSILAPRRTPNMNMYCFLLDYGTWVLST